MDTPRQPAAWMVRFNRHRVAETLAVEGEGCAITPYDGGKRVVVRLPYFDHVLVETSGPGSRVYAGTSVLPVYARVEAHGIRLSNRAAPLFNPGETVRLITSVLMQQLMGANYPQNNLFADLILLEANAVYDVNASGLEYRRSRLAEGSAMDGPGALEMLYENFSVLASDARPLCVLLSGGYDSRFNLAIALEMSRRYGNAVSTYHEYKNDDEYAIARAVAERANVPLHVETRTRFAEDAERLVFDPGFIGFHSSTYRDNIPRWHCYLSHIRSKVPEGLIIGHGAEAHKGKFYRQVEVLRPDAERVFGADAERIAAASRQFCQDGYDRTVQPRFFDELCERALQFPDHHARVDFVHYHTYVVNGYAHRTYDFQQFFNIPFPFLDDMFLAAVFALPHEVKRDFRLVSDGLARLAPALLQVPFTSGNRKALKDRTPVRDAVRGRMGVLRRLRDIIMPPARKRDIPASAVGRLKAIRDHGASDITRRLLTALRDDCVRAPASPTYVAQAFLYLRLLEAERGVTVTCV